MPAALHVPKNVPRCKQTAQAANRRPFARRANGRGGSQPAGDGHRESSGLRHARYQKLPAQQPSVATGDGSGEGGARRVGAFEFLLAIFLDSGKSVQGIVLPHPALVILTELVDSFLSQYSFQAVE